MNFKPEIKVEGKWYPNGLVFATREEAEDAARDKYMMWSSAEDWRAVESNNEPVNATRLAGSTVLITPKP